MIVSDGDGVLLTDHGSYQVSFDENAPTYSLTPVSSNVAPSSGTYSYSKTGPNSATITLTDSLLGSPVDANLVFSRATTALIGIYAPPAGQTGILVLETQAQQDQNFAPESIAGRSVVTAIKSGTGSYATYGGGRTTFAIAGPTFVQEPMSRNITPLAGTYSYTKTGPNTATLQSFDFFGLGTSTDTIVFSSAYRAEIITADEFGTQISLALLEAEPNPSHGSLVNMSVRAIVPAASSVIPGFVIEDAPQTVLVRAGGPALAAFGVDDTLDDPQITVYSGDLSIGMNDDWSSSNENTTSVTNAAAAVGAFNYTMNSKDAAIVLKLDPGPYTVLVSSTDGSSGEILLEVYGVPDI